MVKACVASNMHMVRYNGLGSPKCLQTFMAGFVCGTEQSLAGRTSLLSGRHLRPTYIVQQSKEPRYAGCWRWPRLDVLQQ